MPDYKKMYLTMCQATEQAISILIAAQQVCEELYLDEPDPDLKIISMSEDNPQGKDA